MDTSLREIFSSLLSHLIGYLPSLFVGLLLLGIGWFVSWLVKRIVVQMCVVLHLERLVIRTQWGKGLSKADLRQAFFNWIGTIAGFAMFLFFLHAALVSLQLTALSDVLTEGVLFVPRLMTASAIFIIGYIIASWASFSIRTAMTREEIPRASLIGRFVKGVLLLFFSAMALVELSIAREIVIIGFSSIIITLGILTIIIVYNGKQTFVKKMLEHLEED